jgi:hypothetical protein
MARHEIIQGVDFRNHPSAKAPVLQHSRAGHRRIHMAVDDDPAFPAYRKALARAIEARSYEQSLPDGHPNKAKAKTVVMLANIAVKAASDELRRRR